GIPTRLGSGAQPLLPLARSSGMHPEAAERFLNAAVALGLLERRGDRYRNAPAMRRLVTPGVDGDLASAITNSARGAGDEWRELAARLARWKPGAGGRTRCGSRSAVRALARSHPLALRVGEALGGAYDFGRHARLLDLGGGSGGTAIGICRVHP